MSKHDLYKTCMMRDTDEIVSIKNHEYDDHDNNNGVHWYLVEHELTIGRQIWWPEICLKNFVL